MTSLAVDMALRWPSTSDTGRVYCRAFALKQKILHFLEGRHRAPFRWFPDTNARLEVVQDFFNILMNESRVLDNLAKKAEREDSLTLCADFGWSKDQELWECAGACVKLASLTASLREYDDEFEGYPAPPKLDPAIEARISSSHDTNSLIEEVRSLGL
jgi:hypothetical protein